MKEHSALTISAPGKVILAGEHAVVYGYPAIVAAVSQRVSVRVDIANKVTSTSLPESTWQGSFEHAIGQIQSLIQVEKVTVSSELPIGKGMGSSAALAVCLSGVAQTLTSDNFDLPAINERAYQLEKFQHGAPSGVDNSVATFGQFLWYRKESEKLKVFSAVNPQISVPTFIAIDSGSPAENTKEMVLRVAQWRSEHTKESEEIFREIEQISRSWLRQIQGDEASSWKELIKVNHQVLSTLKVVSESATQIVKKIENLGGAAKVTGAGGATTGSGILLAYHEQPEEILQWAEKSHIPAWPLELGQPGVKKEYHE